MVGPVERVREQRARTRSPSSSPREGWSTASND
jgi:hypothetical protein